MRRTRPPPCSARRYSLLQLGMCGAGGGAAGAKAVGGSGAGGGALKGLGDSVDKQDGSTEPLLPVIATGPSKQHDGGVQPAGVPGGGLPDDPGSAGGGASDAGEAVPRDQRATARAQAKTARTQ